MNVATSPALHVRVASALLLGLALVLPFEVPLFRLGPLQITSVELLLYLLLAVWAGWGGGAIAVHFVSRPATARTLARAEWSDPMARAAVVWLGVTFTSAAFAPSQREAALKFALRSASGVLLFFAARALAGNAAIVRRLTLALVLGAVLSASTAILEGLVPSSEPLWRHFREQSFDAFGLRRASGVFGYPTMGAMYWEAAIPLVIVVPWISRGQAPLSTRRRYAIGGATSAILVWGILASATRSALAGAAIACVGLFFLARAWDRSLARAAVIAMGVLVLVAGSAVFLPSGDSRLGQRLRWWRDDTWFGVRYEVADAPQTVGSGEVFATTVTLHNTGTLTWHREGSQPTRLSYHWYLEGSTTPAKFDGRRTELSLDVPPNGTVRVVAIAKAPGRAGRYRLAWDLVQEGVTWFSEHGSAPAEALIEVRADEVVDHAPFQQEPVRATRVPMQPGRKALWQGAVALWRGSPLLGIGPDTFRRRYAEVIAPSASGTAFTDSRIHANSFYFETLADTGIAGIIALGLVAWAAALALRNAFVRRDVAGLGFGVAAGTFFVHGVFDYFLEFTPLLCLFWMVLGVASAQGPPAAPSRAPPDTPA